MPKIKLQGRAEEPEGGRIGVMLNKLVGGAPTECGSCGADIGPSSTFVWHGLEEDCRAARGPVKVLWYIYLPADLRGLKSGTLVTVSYELENNA